MISKMQQTTTDWLKQQLETYGDPGYCKIEWETLDELIQQAKAMEKEQIIDAYKYGNQSDVYYKPEQYYTETFKSE